MTFLGNAAPPPVGPMPPNAASRQSGRSPGRHPENQPARPPSGPRLRPCAFPPRSASLPCPPDAGTLPARRPLQTSGPHLPGAPRTPAFHPPPGERPRWAESRPARQALRPGGWPATNHRPARDGPGRPPAARGAAAALRVPDRRAPVRARTVPPNRFFPPRAAPRPRRRAARAPSSFRRPGDPARAPDRARPEH